jgi:uncharacterized protein involved in exopolysaccharide biosynthesis
MATDLEPPPRTLRDHVDLLRSRWKFVAATTACAVAAALSVSLIQDARYRASAEVLFPQERLSIDGASSDQLVDTGRLDEERVIQNEAAFVTSDAVRDSVVDRIGSPAPATARADLDSDVITVTATSNDAERAAEIANAYADTYVELKTDRALESSRAALEAVDGQLSSIDERLTRIQNELDRLRANAAADDDPTVELEISRLEGEAAALLDQHATWQQQRSVIEADAGLSEASAPRIIDTASAPAAPYQPATGRNLVLAMLAGIAAGVLAAYVADSLDDRVRTARDIERATGLPALGTIVLSATAQVDLQAVSLDDPLLVDRRLPISAAVPEGHRAVRVLTVPAGTTRDEARRCVEVLEGAGAPIVACVLIEPASAARHATAPSTGSTRALLSEQPAPEHGIDVEPLAEHTTSGT